MLFVTRIEIIISAVWAVPLVSMFLQENNTLISRFSIQPGQSIRSTTQVTDVSSPISIAIHIERPGEQASDQDYAQQQEQQQVPEAQQRMIRLIETVKNPAGAILSSNELSSNLFTTFQPESTAIMFLT